MRVAVVGATGNVGQDLCRMLLAAGHEVRALTRGGAGADKLNALGAEIFHGTFEDGISAGEFFAGADAAYTMVKTDWQEPDHYANVGGRIADALGRAKIRRVVNLSSIGADISHGGGHLTDFHQLEKALDAVTSAQVIHLRCAWFMENFSRIADGVARYGLVGSMLKPDLPLPVITVRDVAPFAFRALVDGETAERSVIEVQGGEDITPREIVRQISRKIGRPIGYIFIPTDRQDVKAAFLAEFGSLGVWEHRVEMYDCFNEGRARYREARTAANTTPTRFSEFLDRVWMPIYAAAVANRSTVPETFESVMTRIAASSGVS